MEDTRAHDSCSSCGSALQSADIEWLGVGDEGNETVFDIETAPIERAAIVDALISNKIRHRWDDADELVVAEVNGDAVDAILDEVLGAEDEDEADGEESDGDDEMDDFDPDVDTFEQGAENGYEVLSRLFIATGSVMRNRDSDTLDDFAHAAQETLSTSTPFGVDDETWADIQSAARNISAALSADAKAGVDADIKALQNQLQTMV